jgi:hypothetical protein
VIPLSGIVLVLSLGTFWNQVSTGRTAETAHSMIQTVRYSTEPVKFFIRLLSKAKEPIKYFELTA